MFLPKGVIKYNPIRVELVNLEKLVHSLLQDFFTGYCHFTGDTNIVLLVDKGEIERAFCLEAGEPRILSLDAALHVCKSPSMEFKGVSLPSAVVDIMVRLLFCKPLHQNLSTTFTDLKTFLKSLENNVFSGFVEIKMGGNVHYLFMEDGGPRAALYAAEGHLIKGSKALERIFYDVSVIKASINVHTLEHIPLAQGFNTLSKALLTKYEKLKGPKLTKKLWKTLSLCANQINEVDVKDMEFGLENLPGDIRKQEKILCSLLKCQLEQFSRELGEKTTRDLYITLVNTVESPAKEVFGGII